MEKLVNFQIDNNIAWIMMDDGQKNVISPAMIAQLNQALDKAEKAGAVVVLTGRQDVFSAGFDLKVFKSSASETLKMLMGGFTLSRRLLAFPTPVIIACNGHAIAMGSFLLLSGDYRIGVEGDFKIVANEVQIGLTMPFSAMEICRQRLNPSHYDRAVLLSECFHPQTAIGAGFLDQVVAKEDLNATVLLCAKQYATLHAKAHKASKLRTRRKMLRTLGWAIHKDRFDFIKQGILRAIKKK
ncbi:crotonase/enoyl-CoA hydratase family protein [Marinicella litoralis]|uniref:Enoyl-CoA hydratase n=1 Tax=Marinicella litoralis TaxID=644220 RepID=A0A4R6XSV3_9GAMM|nr:crotonase/enoyl-CoA hydratase family protein [Marinicella litoralis]TDR20493.1 enoyl-CoA hydratase [Marinicella litoralis]